MANRQRRAKIAAETVEILDRREYFLDGQRISIAGALEICLRETKLYTPEELSTYVNSPATGSTRSHVAQITVDNCTTFAGARALLDEGFPEPLCLNFASAKNPGGGFLSGSQAQEECLARASALYASLITQKEYYEANRRCPTCLYTDHAIYTPRAPVFRDDQDRLLASPYHLSFVTSPAVNAGAVRKNEPEKVSRIEVVMRRRIDTVLAIARKHEHRALVLGAWGCGVFANDPANIAQWFRDALIGSDSVGSGRFANAFERVVFAVLDFAENAPTYNAFLRTFAE